MSENNSINLDVKIKKVNFYTLLKGIFSPLMKQRFYYQNDSFEVLLTEEEYNDPVKKQILFSKLGIVDYQTEITTTGITSYKNILEYLFFKKLSLKMVLKLLKSVWNRYKANLSQMNGFIENLPYPSHLKKALLESQNLPIVLKEYNFDRKEDIIKRLEALSDRTTEDRGKEYLQIAEEISLDLEVMRQVKASFVEPFIYFILVIGTVVFFNTNFFPVMLELAKENPKVLNQITDNSLYILYHGVLDNWILLLIILIWTIITVLLLRQLQVARELWQAFLMKIPFVADMIKYKEYNRFLSIVITYYNSRLKQSILHSYLNAWPLFYTKRLYTNENTVVLDILVKQAVQSKYYPVEEWSNLLSIMASGDVYNHVDEMRTIKKEVLIGYQNAVNNFVKIVRWTVLSITFVAIAIALKGSYGTLYWMITDFL